MVISVESEEVGAVEIGEEEGDKMEERVSTRSPGGDSPMAGWSLSVDCTNESSSSGDVTTQSPSSFSSSAPSPLAFLLKVRLHLHG